MQHPKRACRGLVGDSKLARLLPPLLPAHAKADTGQVKTSLRLLSKKKIVYAIASTTAVPSALTR